MSEIKKKSKKNKILAVLCISVFIISSILIGLKAGCVYADHSWVHWRPDYEKVDITEIIKKNKLGDDDYDTLYNQTGLTRIGVDRLLPEYPRQVLRIQDFYFQPHEVSCDAFNPFTYLETIDDDIPLVKLEDGDIIVSATTHVSGWRLGHAALVVDGDKGLLGEALGPGVKSRIVSISTFRDLADLMILRPRVDLETRKAVAKFARENMIGANYNFSTGILSKKYNEKEFKRTQCAHFVWYAYKKFGIDLDSNRGLVVTPPEIANSPYVDVVQIYGFDPVKLWKK